MKKIVFFKDEKGHVPVAEYLDKLHHAQDRNSRINFEKITTYLEVLREKGLCIGEPYVNYYKEFKDE